MRDYELVIIISPDIEEAATADLVEKVKSWITGSGGNIESQEDWGRQKLAYLIRNHKEGQYFQFIFKMDPAEIASLERNFGLQEAILRFLIVNLDE